MFDPHTNKYPYTEYTDQHYLVVKKDLGITFDDNYPYLNETKKRKFVLFWVRFMMYILVYPLMHILRGFKIVNKKNLKKHKEVISNGVISVCNHIHLWDFIGIMCALGKIKPRFLSWARNINGENGPLLTTLGAIPIPEEDIKATKAYLKAVETHLSNHGWLHIYAEGSMWEYYRPIRPFKRGAAYLACKYDKPIIPMAYSFRKPGWIRKHIFRQLALLTLNIGEPIYRNKELNAKEQELDLTKRSHEAVCRLAGINPNENLYPPIFDHNKRIDY